MPVVAGYVTASPRATLLPTTEIQRSGSFLGFEPFAPDVCCALDKAKPFKRSLDRTVKFREDAERRSARFRLQIAEERVITRGSVSRNLERGKPLTVNKRRSRMRSLSRRGSKTARPRRRENPSYPRRNLEWSITVSPNNRLRQRNLVFPVDGSLLPKRQEARKLNSKN